jgi:hypothetical protein
MVSNSLTTADTSSESTKAVDTRGGTATVTSGAESTVFVYPEEASASTRASVPSTSM